jgi:hypothetical protein
MITLLSLTGKEKHYIQVNKKTCQTGFYFERISQSRNKKEWKL